MQRNKNKPTPTDSKFRSLVSLNQAEYNSLYVVFDQLVRKKLSVSTLKGSMRLFANVEEPTNSSLYGNKIKLDFILMYRKENPNQSYMERCLVFVKVKSANGPVIYCLY